MLGFGFCCLRNLGFGCRDKVSGSRVPVRMRFPGCFTYRVLKGGSVTFSSGVLGAVMSEEFLRVRCGAERCISLFERPGK